MKNLGPADSAARESAEMETVEQIAAIIFDHDYPEGQERPTEETCHDLARAIVAHLSGEDDDRLCSFCGADILGNDPHAPNCLNDPDQRLTEAEARAVRRVMDGKGWLAEGAALREEMSTLFVFMTRVRAWYGGETPDFVAALIWMCPHPGVMHGGSMGAICEVCGAMTGSDNDAAGGTR
jgi:hypothetical protein